VPFLPEFRERRRGSGAGTVGRWFRGPHPSPNRGWTGLGEGRLDPAPEGLQVGQIGPFPPDDDPTHLAEPGLPPLLLHHGVGDFVPRPEVLDPAVELPEDPERLPAEVRTREPGTETVEDVELQLWHGQPRVSDADATHGLSNALGPAVGELHGCARRADSVTSGGLGQDVPHGKEVTAKMQGSIQDGHRALEVDAPRQVDRRPLDRGRRAAVDLNHLPGSQ